MSALHLIGPFRPNLSIRQMGEETHRLNKAMSGVPGCEAVSAALGDPHLRQRRAQALALICGLPARDQDRILSKYEHIRRRETVGG